MASKLCIIGWDGRSNPIYRFEDQLKLRSWERDIPTVAQILEQYPEAKYTKADFTTVPLSEAGFKY